MKICHYLPSLNLNDGGPPRSVSFICKELALLGHDVTILTSQKDKSADIDIFSKINRANCIGKKSLQNFFKSNHFDLVHTHGIWLLNTHHVNNIVNKLRIPLIISPRGMLETWAVNHKRIKKFIAWMLFQKNDLKKADAFHATALSECFSIKNKGFLQKSYCIPNGVHPLTDIEKKSRVSENKKILFLSRINKKKGLDFLLEAWAKVSAEEWILQIAGNDDDGTINYIKERIKREDLRGRVELLGPLSEEQKKLAYTKAGLFILPSHSENFGIVVAEALSYGVPVITTKGCPWEDLKNFDCGWWIDLDISEISNAISKYIFSISSQRKKELSRNAIRLVESKYKWESIAVQFENMYTRILKD
jgi:glycosyltransferase involved in cell wall biosynthesis|tara:strand:+ start:2843 stop:3928 length:1086 start_codon:yes stop_codon:yes gene_type:complete